jgi:plasmid stabilization system protein ParE
MALKIEVKKRFIGSMQKIHGYLEKEWNISVADNFKKITDNKIKLLSRQPHIGKTTTIKNVRSVLAGKGYQNRIYYRVIKDKLVIIDIKDTRMNPKQNRFS